MAAFSSATAAQPTGVPSGAADPTRPNSEAQTPSEDFDRVRFTNQSASHYYNNNPTPAQSEPAYVFFPPVTPPLDAEIQLLPAPPAEKSAPPELAAYVGELFYPLLAERLAANDLPKSLHGRLQAYRDAKLALQGELQTKISELSGVDQADRQRQLAAFAAVQTPRIIELEATAEVLRADLRRSSENGLPADAAGLGNLAAATRPPAPAGPTSPPALPRRAQAAQEAAFFQEGLSPAQRRLLREAALDPDPPATEGNSTSASAAEGWTLSFSPEPARIRLMTNLPAQLAEKISEYVSQKSGLKAELREAIARSATTGSHDRIEAMRRLAAAQAPRLASLEAAAEEIRIEFAALPEPPGPPSAPALPPGLTTRISAYRAHKVEVLKTLFALLAVSPRSDGPDRMPEGPSGDDGGSGMSGRPHESAVTTKLSPANLSVSVEEFNRRQSALVADLNRELAGIREALSEFVRSTNPRADRKSIADLLSEFESARQKQETWARYREYQEAVLLPGLSPQQRRLLFDAAVEVLSLPLPAAEKTN
ncbi:MAG TPA: hypothetical protein VGM73_06645 [Candidatus Didemnitutus sp.]